MRAGCAPRIAIAAAHVGLVAVFMSLAATAVATPIEWPVAEGGNGHYYELVRVQSDFATARVAAEGLSYLGTPGHLATVDLAGEPSWLYTNITLPGSPNLEDYWLGASVPIESYGNINAYAWVTGGAVTAEQRSFPGEAWYIDWAEGYGAYGLLQTPRAWWTSGWRPQDIRQDYILDGYVVEYPVPEPATGLLLLAGAALLRRR